MKRLLVGFAALLVAAAPVTAQEVGKTEWNGYPVTLNADGTWFFDCGGYPAVLSKTVRMAFCFDPAVWTKQDDQAGAEFFLLSADETTGLLVMPSTTIYSPSDLHTAVAAAAASNAGVTVEALGVTDAPAIEVDGKTFAGSRYLQLSEGTEFSYLDYHTSGDAGTVQLVFWTAPGDEAASAAKADALVKKMIFGD